MKTVCGSACMLWSVFLVISLVHVTAQVAQKLTQSNPCTSKQSCSECLQTPSCAWCAKPNFTTPDGKTLSRCNQESRFINNLAGARCDGGGAASSSATSSARYLVSMANTQRITSDRRLTKAHFSASGARVEAVQIRPQRVQLSLRANEAFELAVQFAQAEDYPVDLYYLMDLSKSMEDDKEKLSVLGDLLAEEMQKITTNFRLGFGSFVDKVVMPYVSTVRRNLIEPCTGCAAPYGYKNIMPLSSDTTTFANEVRNAEVSGNLDAPEGGFDAIMQAVVCKSEIGWRNKARKLLVFSTDAGFHYAGDGKLGGIVKPNDGICHLDTRGSYTHSTMLDYPSVSQINQKVKSNSINLIFAVTAEQRLVYDRLRMTIEGSFSGTLSNDSSNVVDLVKAQYDKITSAVEIKDNSTEAVRVTYFSSCLAGGAAKETNKCKGLKVGTRVNFTARIEITKCPKDPREWRQTFQIYPVGINESLLVNLEMLCQCDCERPGNPLFKPQRDAAECGFNGTFSCGVCQCDALHFGQRCECSSNNLQGSKGDEDCRPTDNSTDILCSGRGECVCGVCECYGRENPDELVDGKLCECDNFSCDRNKGKLCSGPDHGVCDCGKCTCKTGWKGNACECPASNDTCIAPGEIKECSGNGQCLCGQCVCNETSSGRYYGKYCEECPACTGKCLLYRPCVECYVHGPPEERDSCNCTFIPIEVDIAQAENDNEKVCTFTDDKNCRFTFVYGYNSTGDPVVRAQKTKKCPPVLDVVGIVLTVIAAIVVVGLALLLLWKLLTTIHDRREFARFEKERKLAKWDTGENPIFKQATSTYKNPAYGGK